MKTGLVLAAAMAAAGLGGCAVTSETPLFAVDQAPRHPLKEGLWAVSGPGCEVKPLKAGEALPECVGMTITITGPKMSWEMLANTPGNPLSQQLRPLSRSMPNATGFVLAEGEPDILEMLNGATAEFSGERPPGAANLKVGYNALRVLEQDSSGRVVKAVLWPVFCPDDLQASGFKPRDVPSGFGGLGSCVAENVDAVRAQARHMKPFLSLFVTWVR
jgi:hypothetical protein